MWKRSSLLTVLGTSVIREEVHRVILSYVLGVKSHELLHAARMAKGGNGRKGERRSSQCELGRSLQKLCDSAMIEDTREN